MSDRAELVIKIEGGRGGAPAGTPPSAAPPAQPPVAGPPMQPPPPPAGTPQGTPPAQPPAPAVGGQPPPPAGAPPAPPPGGAGGPAPPQPPHPFPPGGIPPPLGPPPASPLPVAKPLPTPTSPLAGVQLPPGLPGLAAASAAVAGFRIAIQGAITAVGAFAEKLVSPSTDPSQYVDLMGESVLAVSTALTLVLGPVGGLGIAAGAAALALGSLMRTFDDIVDRYAAFNPQLAMAKAQADVTQIMGEFRRAQTVGPELANYVRSRTELQQRTEDIKVRFIVRFTPIILRMMSVVEEVLPALELSAGTLTSILEFVLNITGKMDAIKAKMKEPPVPEGSLPSELIWGAGSSPWASPWAPYGEGGRRMP